MSKNTIQVSSSLDFDLDQKNFTELLLLMEIFKILILFNVDPVHLRSNHPGNILACLTMCSISRNNVLVLQIVLLMGCSIQNFKANTNEGESIKNPFIFQKNGNYFNLVLYSKVTPCLKSSV